VNVYERLTASSRSDPHAQQFDLLRDFKKSHLDLATGRAISLLARFGSSSCPPLLGVLALLISWIPPVRCSSCRSGQLGRSALD